MSDLFDVESLLPELILALGLALLLGNGYAWYAKWRGRAPRGTDPAQFRSGRTLFLSAVGLLMTIWGAVTLFA